MSPRVFERPAAIAMGGAMGEQGHALEGLFTPVDSEHPAGAVIAPPHPLYGGSMDSPVVTEIAHACSKAGLVSLRFNWRGAGASAGELSEAVEKADEDYLASIRFLEESAEGDLVACGYSFGAAVAARMIGFSTRVRRLLLVAPLPAMLDPATLSDFTGGVFVAVGGQDQIADARDLEKLGKGLRRSRFVVIPEADHFFMRGLAELGAAATDWLSEGELSD